MRIDEVNNMSHGPRGFACYMASVASSATRITAQLASLAAARAAVLGATGSLDAVAVARVRRNANRCRALSREATEAYRCAIRAESNSPDFDEAAAPFTTRASRARTRANTILRDVEWLLATPRLSVAGNGMSAWSIPVGLRARLLSTLASDNPGELESVVLDWSSAAEPRDQLLAMFPTTDISFIHIERPEHARDSWPWTVHVGGALETSTRLTLSAARFVSHGEAGVLACHVAPPTPADLAHWLAELLNNLKGQ